MPKINPEIESFARIKVVGIGGSGTNAVNHMVESKVQGVEFIVMNTDAQHLHHSPANKKLHIGKNLTRGLGTGMDPDLGRRAAEESLEDIQALVKGADMIFISCGMGGGTGTGAAPVVAKVAKELGALTIGVVTRPFYFEAKQRKMIADKGVEELKKEVDAIISIPNDRLLNMISKDTTLTSAFSICDDVLKQAVEGISNTITMPGQINTDFADIKAIMQNSGSTLMGVGIATGENRAIEAAKMAISSPLLDVSIIGAKGILFTVSGGDDVTLFELQEAAKVITESIDPEAKVILGTIHDDKMKKNEVKVTVIACGFPSDNNKKGQENFRINLKTETNSVTPTTETTQPKEEEIRKEENSDKKADIFETKTNKEEIKSTTSPKEKKEEVSFEDDDWSSIPAFLRRSKTK
ncbi:MAG TPA: cell division protein FtsZ [Candidatus Paceibacterota bacterium]|nr:cell division protein FtsZ [Candidatus Paceibacterota bacterium]